MEELNIWNRLTLVFLFPLGAAFGHYYTQPAKVECPPQIRQEDNRRFYQQKDGLWIEMSPYVKQVTAKIGVFGVELDTGGLTPEQLQSIASALLRESTAKKCAETRTC